MKKDNQTKKVDRRTTYTRNMIKESLLELIRQKTFEKITVTEVCKMSEINRGTFYIHYYDLYDALDDILEEISKETSDVLTHLNIIDKEESHHCTYPLCKKIQEGQKYKDILFNDSLTSYIINKIFLERKDEFINNIIELCNLSYSQAEAILIFQINGCIAINKAMYEKKDKN
jgi:AcrR family transcriptional regulator